MTGAITMAATAVVGLGMSAYNMSQQQGITNQASGESSAVFGEQQDYAAQLHALLANPSSVTSLPGYQFNFDQGSESVARQMAAGGFLDSGNEATALTKFGQDYATNAYMTQAQLLAQLSGLTAPSSPSQLTGAATGASALSSSTASGALNSLMFMNLLNRQNGSGVPGTSPATGADISEGMNSLFAGSGYTF